MTGWLRRTPLRIKLVAAVVLLVAGGLVVSAIVATAALHNYLLQRVDDQLTSAAIPPEGCSQGGGLGGRNGPPGSDYLPSQFYVAQYTAAGTTRCITFAGADTSGPKIGPLTATSASALPSAPFTVAGSDDANSWRVNVMIRRDGDVTVIATSLSDVDHTVGRLIVLESAIGAVVLLVLAGLGYVVIRRSLRPLLQVEETAAAIAAGDLSQRVPAYDERTEVGRLTGALNGMLHQIEEAFARQQASEQAARASEDRMRRFVADASHELRTPLTSIRGFAELYRMGAAASPADVARVMQRVEDESTRMGLLVEDLLLLARLDQERPLVREPVDLLAVADDVVHDARLLAAERSVTLSVVGRPPVVLGDEPRLRQVVHNLVANALRHTPSGTPVAVRVGVAVGPASGDHAFVEVADSGPGLSPEAQERVFERFYRTDSARNREAGGTGLGLSIVAALVAAHAGRVSVESEPGRGATFRVELPLQASAASQRLDSHDSEMRQPSTPR